MCLQWAALTPEGIAFGAQFRLYITLWCLPNIPCNINQTNSVAVLLAVRYYAKHYSRKLQCNVPKYLYDSYKLRIDGIVLV